ncbi:MAG TPA: BrnA antitoxin family protein [Devosia sp.]|nr:BrnA antitoxin family protein [Devosia sp.]
MTKKHIRDISDVEEAAIQRQIINDPDAPEATDEQLAQAKPFGEAFPELMESIKRGRGRPRLVNAKEAVTLRVDPATVAKFKSMGDNWRSIMADVLEHADGK